MRIATLVVVVTLTPCAVALAAETVSPYAGQERREIKALSEQEIGDYLAGKGMGLAKAAELNRYPGPAHVLELAAALDLSAEQKARTEQLFRGMQEEAKTLGRLLVDEEGRLDGLFASRTVTPASLRAALERIGSLQAQLRHAHLEAHLTQTEILSPAQVARYAALRGYDDDSSERRHQGHRH